MLVAVELCSLTVQRDDVSVPNLVASGLFGDGASCVVAAGRTARRPTGARPACWTRRSRLYPDSERVMGFDVGSTGLRIVLDAEVPVVIGRYVGEDVDLLPRRPRAHPRRHRLVGLPPGRAEGDRRAAGGAGPAPTRRSRSPVVRSPQIGNLSSASVLHVLEDTLRERPPAPGSHGLLMAMGPGFCSELVLLRAAP